MSKKLYVGNLSYDMSEEGLKDLFSGAGKVDSAVIELVPRQLIPINNQKGFKKLVCAGFSHPRKYCISNICEKLPISKHACAAARASIFIQPTARAQEVSLALWMKLFALLKTQFF